MRELFQKFRKTIHELVNGETYHNGFFSTKSLLFYWFSVKPLVDFYSHGWKYILFWLGIVSRSVVLIAVFLKLCCTLFVPLQTIKHLILFSTDRSGYFCSSTCKKAGIGTPLLCNAMFLLDKRRLIWNTRTSMVAHHIFNHFAFLSSDAAFCLMFPHSPVK